MYALDANPHGVEHVRQMAQSLGRTLPPSNFHVGLIERMPFPPGIADVVLCNSVLHFARDEAHFRAMLAALWRVLKPGGLLFCRLGSRIGMHFEQTENGLFRVGDGAEWFLVDEEIMMHLTAELDAVLLDPLKTTVVQQHRCMTTWVVRKRADLIAVTPPDSSTASPGSLVPGWSLDLRNSETCMNQVFLVNL